MKSKEWIKGPMDMPGSIPKSRTGSKDLVHNATRKERMSSPTHFKATPADEALGAIPASTKTHRKLEVKKSMNSGYVGDGSMKQAPKSGELNLSPAVDTLPKKWHKQGYDMVLPTSLDGNMRRK